MTRPSWQLDPASTQIICHKQSKVCAGAIFGFLEWKIPKIRKKFEIIQILLADRNFLFILFTWKFLRSISFQETAAFFNLDVRMPKRSFEDHSGKQKFLFFFLRWIEAEIDFFL